MNFLGICSRNCETVRSRKCLHIHRGPARDPLLPEVYTAADPQATVPAAGARDGTVQDRPAFPELGRDGAAGGMRGLPGGALRGHQPVRHPRQASHHHAQGHPACPPHPRGEGINLFSI